VRCIVNGLELIDHPHRFSPVRVDDAVTLVCRRCASWYDDPLHHPAAVAEYRAPADAAAFVASAAHDDATGFDGTAYPGWDEDTVDEYEAWQDNERQYRRDMNTQEGE